MRGKSNISHLRGGRYQEYGGLECDAVWFGLKSLHLPGRILAFLKKVGAFCHP
jgi:hypothetical protein